MKRRYWPIVIIGLLSLCFFWPANKELLHHKDFSPSVRDSSGNLLRMFLTKDDKYRMWSNISHYPTDLIEALLIKEDKYFNTHHGVDIPALFRAGFQTYIKKEGRIGASTLTMQLVRLKDNSYTRSLPGKFIQIIKAIYIDLHYSKQEILEAYLNMAPCGGNIEGFASASEYYFHKKPEDLTLSEILFLVVLPQDPVARSPKNKTVPAETLEARMSLYKKWIDKHPEDTKLESAMSMPIKVECSLPFIAPHATEYIIDNFKSPKGSFNTTINSTYQKIIKEQLEAYIRHNSSIGVKNGAVLLLEYTTGNVLSIIGSRDYFNDSIHGQVKGFAAKRSPGSTLKPFIYALGIEQGIIHPHTMQKDSPQTFGVYTPDNYNSNFRGPVFAWQALVESRNIPAINLANRLGKPDLYDFLKASGISGLKERDHYGLSIVLGSAEVTMLELGKLYGALANRGILQELNFLKDSSGSNTKQIMTPEASFLTMNMLRRNPSPVRYRPKETKEIPIAYKTGTSIGFKDSWSAGVFDDYVIVVWIGNFDGSGNPVFIGRKMAAPLLFSIADAILMEKQPEKKLSKVKKGIRMVPVCSVSGGIPGNFCKRTVQTGFIPGISPITKCHIHREIFIDSRTGYRTDDKESPYVKREIREIWPSDLLELFNNAGLPRLKPPPYPPEISGKYNINGFPPRINSPLNNGEYIIRKEQSRHNSIILDASSDGDSQKLYWFANDSYLGSGTPASRIEWSPETGSYQITAVDDIGRSTSINITVTNRE